MRTIKTYSKRAPFYNALLLVSISNFLRLSTTRYSSLYTGTSTERDGFAKLLFVPFSILVISS
jgi:hypothetical protein